MHQQQIVPGRHIVGITGYSAVGKSTLAKDISEELGMGLFSLGDYQRAEFASYGSPLKYHTKLGLERTYYRKWPEYITGINKNISGMGVVVESIYSYGFLELMRCSFPDNSVHLIEVWALEKSRVERFMTKTCLLRVEAAKQLAGLDDIKKRVGIEEVFKHSDLAIENDGSISELKNLGVSMAIHLMLRK